MPAPLSVLISVRNEVKNLNGCLESLRWAGEIVVVDSGSDDGTVEVAQTHGCKVVNFDWNGRFPKKKNWALEQVAWKHEWVLIIDADERVTPELAAEIQTELSAPRADGYYLNRRHYFLGQWIRHCGYYPSWNLRLLRHARGRYERVDSADPTPGDNEVHEHLILQGTSAYLRHDLRHDAYPDIFTWVEKHNRYSGWEAEGEVRGGLQVRPDLGGGLAWRRWLRLFSRRLPARPLLRFLYSYVWCLGFLDGYRGFLFCRLLATYELLTIGKAYELRQRLARSKADEAG